MDIFTLPIDKNKLDNKNKRVAQYRQLADGIKKLILEEKILGHTFLPSERKLAKELKLDRDIVHSAYKSLEEEGLIKFTNHKGHRLVKNPIAKIEKILKKSGLELPATKD